MAGIGFGQSTHAPFAGPGHWNDPDMLVVGKVGWGPHLHPTRLTPNEQYTHISLWCLLSAPLLIGCDMTQLDPFTSSLLSNDEVIAVNQDPLGKQASGSGSRPTASRGVGQAAGRRVDRRRPVQPRRGAGGRHVKWADLHLTGPQQARDLWRQKDVDAAAGRLAQRRPARVRAAEAFGPAIIL